MSGVMPFGDEAVAYRARWVVSMDQGAIDGGVVTVQGGRIVSVGKSSGGHSVRDLGDVALIPGLINAHTHLEFSGLVQPLGQAGMGFAAWIEEVVRWRRSGSQRSEVGDQRSEVRKGLVESYEAGVVGVGEIASGEWPTDAARGIDGVEVTVFRELLGLAPARVEPLMEMARAHLAGANLEGVRPGLSPHAPYTVHPELLRQVCALSAKARIPLAMHLAESREELELLQSHAGPLVELLQSLGAWHPGELPMGLRPLDYLRQLATAERALVIHGNYLGRDEIELLGSQRERMSAVYCPRTHAYFGHEAYPLAEMLTAGVRVAVGTDSRASNSDLSLFEELRHIIQHHRGVAPADILRMGTLAGAEALGIEQEFGSITPGKRAGLVVVPLGDSNSSPYDAIFTSPHGSSHPLV